MSLTKAFKKIMGTPDADELKALMGNPRKLHEFFIHCRGEYAPENFCCYYMIEAYKASPRKRMATFIVDNYMKSDDDAIDAFGVFTSQLNLTLEGGGTINTNNVKTKAAAKKATYANVGMTLSDKKAAHGVLGTMKMKLTGSTKPAANLFDDLQAIVTSNLLDSHGRFKNRPVGKAPDGGLPLFKFLAAATTAGWSPAKLGMWN